MNEPGNAVSRPGLAVGAVGPQVAALHTKLAAQGFDIPAAEVKGRFFGPATRAAVRSLQRERGLPATGVVNDTVWMLLDATATTEGTARESTAVGPATSGRVSSGAVGRSGTQAPSALVLPSTGHVFPPIEPGPSVTVDLVRADDLLSVRVVGYNLQLDPAMQASAPQLVRIDPSADAYLAYLFPPQSIAEQAFYESKAEFSDTGPVLKPPSILGPPVPPPVPSRMSGLSRLVFRLSPALGAVPFTLAGLLDWSQLSLVVAPVAAGAGPGELPQIRPPSALETAIEMPRRLFISPDPDAPWLHATLPVTHGGRTELWHTRLARPVITLRENTQAEIDLANPGHIRAIWSPDYNPGRPPAKDALDPGFPVLTALSPNNRHQIVALSASYTDYTVWVTWFLHAFAGGRTPGGQEHQVNYSPVAIPVDRLMLSSLGGWLQAHGQWPIDIANLPTSVIGGQSDRLNLSEWVHQATQGRDHYVRVVTEGCLYPFGHRAALVKVTERKFQGSGNDSGDPAAYLRQHMYVIVREPEKCYAGAAFANGGREMPFSCVQLTTRVTPDIDYPYTEPSSITTASFWVMVGQVPFPFHVTALDAGGQQIEFTAGLIFVDGSEQDRPAIQAVYSSRDDLRACTVTGGSIAYAPPSAPGAGDTTLTTDALYFDTQATGTLPCQFLPYLFKADVRIPSLEQLLGTNAASTIKLYDGYLANGLDPHAAVFAQLASGTGPSLSDLTLPVSFSADKAGGFATPNLGVSSISRALGPLAGDPANAVQDTFDPGDFFPANSAAKLFGVFDLAQLIPGGNYGNAPNIRITPQPANAPTEIVTTIDWTPALTSQPVQVGPLTLTSLASRPQLQVHGTITKPVTGSQAGSFLFTGDLTDIRLDFAGVIGITFDRFRFVAQTGRKLDLSVEIAASGGIQFEGDLGFIEQLQNVIPPGIFSDGPSLDVTPTQAVLSYAIGLPPLTVAVFSLEQVKLSTGLTLPFLDGTPLFDFAFAERHNPFLLTIAVIGGGGFFHLQVGADGIKQVEAALEFGGNFALDLGVASGSVHIMAGIYFAMQTNAGNTAVTLSGYLRLGGEVSVLGLISVSVEFYLSFTYDSGTGKATGQATLTVSVSVAFFSVSVDLTVQRSFGSHGGDPTFGQLIDTDAWQQYAAAFA